LRLHPSKNVLETGSKNLWCPDRIELGSTV
jgi:hypothetical protein